MSKAIPQLDPAVSISRTNKIELSQSDAASSESVYGTFDQVAQCTMGNSSTLFSGPSTTPKTFTLPNTNALVLTSTSAFTFNGTLNANTAVTFPTSGTLATSAATVPSNQGTANMVLVNGTVGTPISGTNCVFTTPQPLDTSADAIFRDVTFRSVLVSSAIAGIQIVNTNFPLSNGVLVAPISMLGYNDVGSSKFYGRIDVTKLNGSVGNEAGRVDLRVLEQNILSTYLSLDASAKKVNISRTINLSGTSSAATINFSNPSSGTLGNLQFSPSDGTYVGQLYCRLNVVQSGGDPSMALVTISLKDSGGLNNYVELDGFTEKINFLKPLVLSTVLDATYLNLNTNNLYNNSGQLDTTQDIGPFSTPSFLGVTINDGSLTLFNSAGGVGNIIYENTSTSIDNLGNTVTYSLIETEIEDDTAANPKGSINFIVNTGGFYPNFMKIDGSTSTVTMLKPIRVSTGTAGGLVYLDSNKDLRSVSLQSYTPTIGEGANNFTTSSAVGKYYVAGNLIYFWLDLVWTNKGSANPLGNVIISLPPFAIGASSPVVAPSIGKTQNVGWTGSMLACSGQSGATVLNLFGIANGAATTTVTVVQMGTSGEIHLNGYYIII